MAEYRIGKLWILSQNSKKSDEASIIKAYATFLKAGVNYVAVLTKLKKHKEIIKIIEDIQKFIESCPVDINTKRKDAGFLSNPDDFGKMEHGVN